MKFKILSLFPEFIKQYLDLSIMKKASNNGVEFEVINFRDYALDKHKMVDDSAYSGDNGMVLKPEPIINCLRTVKTQDSFVVLLSPDGEVYNQNFARQWSINKKEIILICGHYEGFDNRIYDYVDQVISIGDFVMTGGELAALVLVDSITRLVNGVINQKSLINESFDDFLLDHPVYTKPRNFENKHVPEILLSGDHKKIKEYNLHQRIEKTRKLRPDLYLKYLLNKQNEKN